MNIGDFVHLALHALGGSISGKTNLQKKVYFLGLLTGKLGTLGYRPHYYGPYSEDVAVAIEDLKSVGFVDQNVIGGFGVDQSGFELRRYDYRLNEVGKKVAEAKAAQHSEFWNALQRAAARLNSAGDLDYMKLSVAAKTYFMINKEPRTATEEELAKLAPRFGWRVTVEEVKEAASYLAKLDLVELTKR